jgi:hypothetical protein
MHGRENSDNYSFNIDTVILTEIGKDENAFTNSSENYLFEDSVEITGDGTKFLR